MDNYYVYALLDPRKPGIYKFSLENQEIVFQFEPYYIGKGKDGRRKDHFTQFERSWNYNTIKFGKIKHIEESGYNPANYTIIIENNLSELNAHQKEKDIISLIGRIDLGTGCLANLTNGGEGSSGLISKHKGKTYEEIYGEEKAEWMKEVRSIRFSGEKNPMFGKESWCKGKHLSAETKQKLGLRAQKVKQLDQDGNLIKLWNNIKEASDFYKVARTTISHVLSKHMNNTTAAGFRWEWENEKNLKYAQRFSDNQRFFKIYSLTNNDEWYIVIKLKSFCLKFPKFKLDGFYDILAGKAVKYKNFSIAEIKKDEFITYERNNPQRVIR